MLSDDISLDYVSGVILYKEFRGERRIILEIFLKQFGIIFASVPVGSSGRTHFGGDIEPLNWCRFKLKKHNYSYLYSVQEVDNFDDMFKVRQRPNALKTVFEWVREIRKYLYKHQPDDELLANFYWNMLLLKNQYVPVDAVNFRFKWKWLQLWGLAPDMKSFFTSKGFSPNEINLLQQVIIHNTKHIEYFFTNNPEYTEITRNIFRIATQPIIPLLNEK